MNIIKDDRDVRGLDWKYSYEHYLSTRCCTVATSRYPTLGLRFIITMII